MKSGKLLLIVGCALLSIRTFAATPVACSPTGTWYGGSDVKYLMTITPITDTRFTITSQPLLDVAALGLPAWTGWSGELRKIDARHFINHSTSLYTTSSQIPPPPDSYELDAVRGTMEISTCNVIKFRYNFYGLYFDLNKVAFVDVPDVSVDASSAFLKPSVACPPGAQFVTCLPLQPQSVAESAKLHPAEGNSLEFPFPSRTLGSREGPVLRCVSNLATDFDNIPRSFQTHLALLHTEGVSWRALPRLPATSMRKWCKLMP